MTNTTGPPPGAILFEILLVGVFVVGIRASYQHWRRGPDLPNSARYGAVAAGLCSAAVGVWTVAFVNFNGNGPALWIGWAMFALAAAFGAAGERSCWPSGARSIAIAASWASRPAGGCSGCSRWCGRGGW